MVVTIDLNWLEWAWPCLLGSWCILSYLVVVPYFTRKWYTGSKCAYEQIDLTMSIPIMWVISPVWPLYPVIFYTHKLLCSLLFGSTSKS